MSLASATSSVSTFQAKPAAPAALLHGRTSVGRGHGHRPLGGGGSEPPSVGASDSPTPKVVKTKGALLNTLI